MPHACYFYYCVPKSGQASGYDNHCQSHSFTSRIEPEFRLQFCSTPLFIEQSEFSKQISVKIQRVGTKNSAGTQHWVWVVNILSCKPTTRQASWTKKNNRKTWAEYTREKSVLKNNVGQYISFLQSWYTNHIRSWWARSAEWRWCCMTGYRAQWANQMSAGMSMPTVSVCTISSTPQMQNVNDKINKISTINIIAKLRIEIHFLPFHTVTALHYQMKTWMIHYSSNVVSILSYVLKVRCAVAVKIHMEANPTQPQIIGLIKDLLFQLANFFAERFRPL